MCRDRMFEFGLEGSAMTFCNCTEQSSLLLSGSFMYFQLFIRLLLEMKPYKNAKKDLLDICKRAYTDNTSIRDFFDEFDHSYTAEKAIYWYTRATCFYRIINKALRQHDAEMMFACCFFIQDLYQQLQEEKVKFLEKLGNTHYLYVYRGQFMSTDELKQIKEHVGQLLSMNSFLSTSTKENIALLFTTNIFNCTDDSLPVLFRIKIDTSLKTLPYADVKHLSQFEDENEVLIMAGAIFKIDAVIWASNEKIWIVELSMQSSDDHDLQPVLDYCKQNHLSKDRSTLICLGILSRDLGQIHTAEMFYRKQLMIDSNNSWALSGLGYVANEKGLYTLALDHYQRALEIDLKLPSNNPKIARDYMDIGNCSRESGDYNDALNCYENSLNFYRTVYGEEHHEIADLYKSMGFLYRCMKDYENEFNYQNKALALATKTLPSTHPYVADICTGVSWSYYNLGNFNQALEYIKRAYDITMKSTPTNSYRTASIYDLLGRIYFKLNDIEKAISSCRKAILIETHAESLMTSLQADTYNQLAEIYEHNKQYSEALETYNRAVDIFSRLGKCDQSMEAIKNAHRMKILLKELELTQRL